MEEPLKVRVSKQACQMQLEGSLLFRQHGPEQYFGNTILAA